MGTFIVRQAPTELSYLRAKGRGAADAVSAPDSISVKRPSHPAGDRRRFPGRAIGDLIEVLKYLGASLSPGRRAVEFF